MSPFASGPSSWAIERFGTHLAGELWTRIPQAMAAAVTRSLDAHDASGMHTDHAFGSGWPIPYEELVNHLRSLPGAHPVQPPRAFFELIVVGGHLLLPWRYANRPGVPVHDPLATRPIGQLGREILRYFGPPPRWIQDPLPFATPPELERGHPGDDDDDDAAASVARAVLATFHRPPRVLVIGYCSTSAQGLLSVYWGDAALASDGDGHVRWRYVEPLPLPPAHIPRQRSMDGLTA